MPKAGKNRGGVNKSHFVHMRNRAVKPGLALFCTLLVAGARAQTPPAPPPPNAGSVLQQVQPSLIPAPGPEQAQPAFLVPRAVVAPSSGGGGKVQVSGFRIDGLPAARTERLLPMLQKYVGADKTLADLEDAAKDIEVALQREGLFLAQAYVPEQKLSDGVVTIRVLEGRIGSVKIEIEPGVKVAPEFLDRIVDALRGNPVAERDAIERVLFILGDLRGIALTTKLSPGGKVGQADIEIRVSRAQAATFSADLDNGGSLFTGRYRLNIALDLASPAGRGDVFSLRGQVSETLGSEFLRASWLTPINASGTKIGLAASALHYKLGSDIFKGLDAHGTAEDYALQVLHPLIRSRNSNFFLQGSTDYRRFDDKVDAVGLNTKKDIFPYATVNAIGDFRDGVFGGAISNYQLGVAGGKLRINSPADLAFDQQGVKTAGGYAKLQFGGSRLQSLPTRDYLYLALSGQLASKNLDSSEKFSMGGPNGVRGYPSPESPSDSGVVATWEYRKSLSFDAVPGELVASVFGDYGYAKLHDNPLPGDDPNIRRLLSHGVGLTFAGRSGLSIKGYVAARGGLRAQSDDSRFRFYLLLSQQL